MQKIKESSRKVVAVGHNNESRYLLNILGQGQRRAVLLTATGSDSKSDLLSPQLFEKFSHRPFLSAPTDVESHDAYAGRLAVYSRGV